MKKSVFALNLILVAALAAAAQLGTMRPNNLHAGAVYVMTNQVDNAVMAFTRSPKSGELMLVDTEPTQGAGDPVPIPPDPPVDPLASQGALILDGSFIYAVNAGSNEISVLTVGGRTGLDFVQKISSGGTRPISLTLWGDWLYVLNEGGTPNITGFSVADDGTLTPIAGSTQPLIGGASADPAQVGFNSGGTLLVVTEKAGNRLDTYAVDAMGVAGPPMANASAGMTPFGFGFSKGGFLFVSEAFGGMPMMGAVSSYDTDGSILDAISSSVPNNQTATCWLVVTNSGRNIFVSNTASDSISSYAASDTGVVTLNEAVAANTGAMSAPVDMALSVNSQFLYVLENGSHTVSAWSVGKGGSLEMIGEFGMIPPGAQGIAAK